jgi:hypothetical protein
MDGSGNGALQLKCKHGARAEGLELTRLQGPGSRNTAITRRCRREVRGAPEAQRSSRAQGSVRSPFPLRAGRVSMGHSRSRSFPKFEEEIMRTLLPVIAALVCGAGLSQAQSLTSVIPAAAEPGDLLVLRGSGLGSVVKVAFQGQVGGFVGVWNVSAAPLSVSANEVRVIVPLFNNFVGPAATPPSNPFGKVSVIGTGTSNQLDFYFMEEKHGQVTTPGQGTTQSNGERPVCSFALTGGEPVSNNPNFTPVLGLGVTGALPVLVVGQQAIPPFLPIGDGALTINFSLATFAVVVGPPVDANGASAVALPIPKVCPMPTGTFEDPVCGFPVAFQWGMLDPVSQSLVVSNGMFVTL